MHPLVIFAFVGVMGIPFHSVHAGTVTSTPSNPSNYTYKCYPDNTISIGNLPTTNDTMYYHAISHNNITCSANGSAAEGTANITGCPKNTSIYFSFGTYNDMLKHKIQGGETYNILNITCKEISAEGVAITLSDTFGASIVFGDEKMLNVTYDVTSSIEPTTAVVGESVKWTIQFPGSYVLEISTCQAYPGTNKSIAIPITLITDWCTQVDELISSFSTNDANTEATATIQAFKFYDYKDVFLVCDVLVCPNDDGQCVSSCASTKKKRSEIDYDGMYIKRVGQVLHVIDNTSGTAAKCSGFFLPLLLLVLTSFL